LQANDQLPIQATKQNNSSLFLVAASALIIISTQSIANQRHWEKMDITNYQFDDFSLAYNLNKNLCIISQHQSLLIFFLINLVIL
jgi:hypothetical protein